MGKHQCTACKRTFRTAQGLGLHFNHARKNPKVCDGQPRIDPRDAEIARLKAEVERLTARITDHEDDRTAVLSERCATDEHHCACVPVLRADLAAHKRALAAGPADLRWRGPMSGEEAARNVERAQAAAMKEKP